MSLKNQELSPFGRRLADMMGDKSPRDLANDLLKEGLVHVKSQKEYSWTTDNNAIGSVEKKIRAHLKADNPNKLQGEFVLAYCQYFHCSADYLFCRTDIKTPNIAIRSICELTGLSEAAVGRLVYHGGDPRTWQWNSVCWSRLIESQVYDDIEKTIPILQSQQMEKAQAEASKEELSKAMKGQGGKTSLNMQEDMEGYEQQIQSSENGISGSLFLISRDVSNVLEKYYVTPAANLKDVYRESAIQEIRDTYGIEP
jgi:hypothetical protein